MKSRVLYRYLWHSSSLVDEWWSCPGIDTYETLPCWMRNDPVLVSIPMRLFLGGWGMILSWYWYLWDSPRVEEGWSCLCTGTNETLLWKRRNDPTSVLVPMILFSCGWGLILPWYWYLGDYSLVEEVWPCLCNSTNDSLLLKRRDDPAHVLVPIILFFGGGGLILLLDWYQWYSFLAEEGWSCSCTGTYGTLFWWMMLGPAQDLIVGVSSLVEEGLSCLCIGTYDTLLWWRRDDPGSVLVPMMLFSGGGGMILPLYW